ncbi:MAG TPA: MaoC/PaaZ C-terminal domain-containing protein [Jatrophihabitans sp.]|nr:MaoC/PaaZ C-terminal domain-containing protein [Jatrophihabitans sp.]
MTTHTASMAVIEEQFGEWGAPSHSVADERWLQPYAAAVGDTAGDLFDLAHPGGIVAHPVFVVCPEWPIILAEYPAIDMPLDARRRGLHVQHSIRHHASIRVGDHLTTRARLVTAEMRSIGAFIQVEFETSTRAGEKRATSMLSMLYPGVELHGAHPRGERVAPQQARVVDQVAGEITVCELNAPIYTECARIWNPIHTDARVAEEYGLPAPVLHGTEILARAVSIIKNDYIRVGSESVSYLSCRFASMVLPGMALTVRCSPVHRDESGWSVDFDVHIAGDAAAISDGRISGR